MPPSGTTVVLYWAWVCADRMAETSGVTPRAIRPKAVSPPIAAGLASAAQADVEASFQVADLGKAEPFDPAWRGADAQAVCAARGADARGGVGPFGLWVLASDDRDERTAVFFRVFKDGGKHVVLMCNDPSMSSHADDLYKPTFAAFVDVDIAQAGGKIALRTLVRGLLGLSE